MGNETLRHRFFFSEKQIPCMASCQPSLRFHSLAAKGIMDDVTESKLHILMIKHGLSAGEKAFVDQESSVFSSQLREALQRDRPNVEFTKCRLRAIHPDRLIFTVWFEHSGRNVLPPPYYLYSLIRNTGTVEKASAEDQKLYSINPDK